MKVKMKRTGKIREAKRFKDLAESVQADYENVKGLGLDEFIFTRLYDDVWTVYTEDEVEILEEEK